VLTTGTGSIFGFLVAREAYDAALEAPLFIAASFLYGLAFTVLVLAVTSSQTREDLVNEEMVGKFRGLFYIFAFSVLYFTILLHLSKLYASAHQGIEAFILLDGGVYTLTFWVGQIAIGTLAPIALLYFGGEGAAGRRSLTIASVLFIVGGLAQMFVVIVGGEAYPLDLFPGMAVSSSFYDGVVTVYHPSLPEILLGLSGISLSMLVVALALRLLPFLPRAQAH
jgi:molybdopterin-containing oxidoreductase family membrane subunit